PAALVYSLSPGLLAGLAEGLRLAGVALVTPPGATAQRQRWLRVGRGPRRPRRVRRRRPVAQIRPLPPEPPGPPRPDFAAPVVRRPRTRGQKGGAYPPALGGLPAEAPRRVRAFVP